eukprot:Rhum_TRINITY_DN10393_c0_g1::Rhum_TRINITY_DN10393_c0_g1_i1::g.38240::m.38240
MPSYLVEVEEGGVLMGSSARSPSSCLVKEVTGVPPAPPPAPASVAASALTARSPSFHATPSPVHSSSAAAAVTAAQQQQQQHQVGSTVAALRSENHRLRQQLRQAEEKLRASARAESAQPPPAASEDFRTEMLRQQEKELMQMEAEVALLKQELGAESRRRVEADKRALAGGDHDARAKHAEQRERAAAQDTAAWRQRAAELEGEATALKEERECTRAKVAQYEEDMVRWQEDAAAVLAAREAEHAGEAAALRARLAEAEARAAHAEAQRSAVSRDADDRATRAESEARALRLLSLPSPVRSPSPVAPGVAAAGAAGAAATAPSVAAALPPAAAAAAAMPPPPQISVAMPPSPLLSATPTQAAPAAAAAAAPPASALFTLKD